MSSTSCLLDPSWVTVHLIHLCLAFLKGPRKTRRLIMIYTLFALNTGISIKHGNIKN